MSYRCPTCGAVLAQGISGCESLRDELLAFEYANAVPHRTHFLMVTCYLVQHNQYSDEALGWAEDMLRRHLDETLSAQELTRQLTQPTRGGPRNWRFTRHAEARVLPRVRWTLTIGDILSEASEVARYQRAVRRWAEATLRQMPELRY